MFKAIYGQLRQTYSNFQAIKGNSKGCLISEPMWGIPYNLYASYASLYMLALGVTESQIGIIATLNVGCQMLFSLIGGFITDKLGRRRTSLIFDLISWSLPTLLWAFAGSLVYFVIGAILNAVVRVVYTSWTCLLIEDAPKEQRVHVYSFIHIAGILAGFVAPLAGIVVRRYGLVPSVRGLYLFAFVSMTFMFFFRNAITRETKMGIQRMAESKGVTIVDSIKEYGVVLKVVVKNRLLLMTLFLMFIHNVFLLIKSTFLSILLRNGIGLSLETIAVVPAINSAVMLVTLFILMPALSKKGSGFSLLLGVSCMGLSTLLLIIAPAGSFFMVILSTVLGAFGVAIEYPFIEATIANLIDERTRAKTMSLIFATVLVSSSPFGYISGVLAALSPRYPYVLLIGIQILGIVMALIVKGQLEVRRARSG